MTKEYKAKNRIVIKVGSSILVKNQFINTSYTYAGFL